MAENKIKKDSWQSRFSFKGKVKVGDRTFKIDEPSKNNPNWLYSQLNLAVDCGEYGTHYVQLMGGRFATGNNVIYAHGKNDDGSDDYKSKVNVPWDERFDKNVLADIGDSCFTRVGLEKDAQNKLVFTNYLTPYDAVQYLKDNLSTDMTVGVSGSIRYDTYKDSTTAKFNLKSIWLITAEEKDFCADFTQTFVFGKDAIDKKNLDASKGVVPFDAYVIEYCKEYNGREIKAEVPLPFQFTVDFDVNNKDMAKRKLSLLTATKDYTQATYEGSIMSLSEGVDIRYEDLDPDIKQLVELGLYTKEEVVQKAVRSTGGTKADHFVLKRPKVDNDMNILIKPGLYTEDELFPDYLTVPDIPEDMPDGTTVGSEDMSWLDDMI